MTRKIVADENIPYAKEAFAALGDTVCVPAAQITPELVQDAEILLVRSVTKVNEALLKGSTVKYAATATIGVDHIDQDYLSSAGIAFSSAPGSNANSVSEFITAALLKLAVENGISFADKTIGIIGVGNVGSRVQKKAQALGFGKVLLNDPPRARAEEEEDFTPLDQLLEESDVVTIHVPLTKDGTDKTSHLADKAFFSKMKDGAIFLNSSRGDVVDEDALLEALQSGKIHKAVLDVWHAEPAISAATLQKIEIATPHIAGYSFDGKVNGTRMIYEGACKALGLEAEWDPTPLLPSPEVPQVRIDVTALTDEQVLHAVVSQVYNIAADDRRMRGYLDLDGEDAGKYFTRLRKEYPRRREFQYTTVTLDKATDDLKKKAAGLGFRTV